MTKPEFKAIPIEKLQRGTYQPRRQFNQESLEELAQSIISSGLIQPVVVRPIALDSYEIVAGERRFRAAQIARLATIPCIIHHYSDEQTAAVAAIENINRVDLNPIEEAQAYQRLIDEFAYSHEQLATLIGKSRVTITNALRLLKLDERAQALLIEKKLTVGHGKILAGLPMTLQYSMALQCISQDLSVRQLENEVFKITENTSQPQKDTDPNIKALEQALSSHIGCQVTLEVNHNTCRLHMDCHNLDVFQGVLEKMGFKNT